MLHTVGLSFNDSFHCLSYMLHLLIVSHAPSTDRVSFRNQACMTWLVVIIWLVQWSATISQNLACATQEESKRNQSESDCRWKRNSNAWLLLRSQDVLIRFITELLKAFDAVLAQQHCSRNVGKRPLRSRSHPGTDRHARWPQHVRGAQASVSRRTWLTGGKKSENRGRSVKTFEGIHAKLS